MSTRLTIITLSILLLASLSFAVYTSSRLATVSQQVDNWKDKHEEALIDVQEAYKRLQEKEDELKRALDVAEQQRRIAEEAITEREKQRVRK
jgi:hypothetical protein